jgi:hypothetical protein
VRDYEYQRRSICIHVFTIDVFVGVEEVCVSLITGHFAIIGRADAASLGELLAARLRRPVFLLPDFAAAPTHPASPAPPAGGENAVMPPASHAPPAVGENAVVPPVSPAPPVGGGYHPWPAPLHPVGGYYNPYVRHYAAPQPEAGYYYYAPPPFGGRPAWEDDALADIFDDEHRDGRCCSIQ